jgi:putative SOS response-associated peptidase YedK
MVPAFDAEQLARWLERAHYRPRYNVAPSQPHYVVQARRGRPILARATWGMHRRRDHRLVINARAETVHSRPMFRRAFERGRCLVPADGFFEWDRRRKPSQPYWFHAREGTGLLFAGVFADEEDGEEHFVVVTVPAVEEVAKIHDRMPALIHPAAIDSWLFGEPDEARALLEGPFVELRGEKVSTRVNSTEHDDPACIQPA